MENKIIEAINQGYFDIGDRQDGENTVVYVNVPYDEIMGITYAIAFDNMYDSVTVEIMTDIEFEKKHGVSMYKFNDIVNSENAKEDNIKGVYQINYIEVK